MTLMMNINIFLFVTLGCFVFCLLHKYFFIDWKIFTSLRCLYYFLCLKITQGNVKLQIYDCVDTHKRFFVSNKMLTSI